MSIKFSELVSEDIGAALDLEYGFPVSRMIEALQRINTATPSNANAASAFSMSTHTGAIAATALHDILEFVNNEAASFEGIAANLTIWNGMLRSGVQAGHVLSQVDDYVKALAFRSTLPPSVDAAATLSGEESRRAQRIALAYAEKLKKMVADEALED